MYNCIDMSEVNIWKEMNTIIRINGNVFIRSHVLLKEIDRFVLENNNEENKSITFIPGR